MKYVPVLPWLDRGTRQVQLPSVCFTASYQRRSSWPLTWLQVGNQTWLRSLRPVSVTSRYRPSADTAAFISGPGIFST